MTTATRQTWPAFFRAMATIGWACVRHPTRTTYVDLNTGRECAPPIQPEAIICARDGIVYRDNVPLFDAAPGVVYPLRDAYDLFLGPVTPEKAVELAEALTLAAEIAARPVT